MIEVVPVLNVTTKVVGFALGACASDTVVKVLLANLPQNLSKVNKITCVVGSAAIGSYVADRVRKGFVHDWTIKENRKDYIKVETDEKISE